MQKRKVRKLKKKRFLSAALSAALVFSSVAALIPGVSAQEAAPGKTAEETYRPWKHGYRITDVLNWSPETDRYSDLMGNKVPLQERIDTFAPTQANPNLSDKTKLYNITDDYRGTGTSPFDKGAYNDEFSNNVYKFWQYTDLYGGGGRPTSMYNITDDTNGLEFGIVDFPNAAYIAAAHKNGVKSFGMLFIPRTPQYAEEMLFEDENGEFPVAKKLVEMAQYYGFDGYFINQEAGINSNYVNAYKRFAKYLREQGLDISWYDVTDSNTGSGPSYYPYLTESHSGWLVDEELGRICSSMFINYNWNEGDNNVYSQNVVRTNELLASLGLDPYNDVYFGVESNLGRYNGAHNSTRNLDQILDPETGNPMASLALWSSGFTSDGLDADLGDGNQRRRYDKDYQWMVEERERMLYTSVLQDASKTDEVEGFSYPEVGVSDGSEWTGISRYVSERSVIGGDNFYTNFNTGHGLEWRAQGERISAQEWSNISIQDILPTWQWWMDSEGTALQVDYDYGPDYTKAPKFSYEQIGAYQGGNSLAVSGTLDSENFLRLFKSDLNVKDTTKFSITYNKVSATDSSKIELGVVFKNDPGTVVTFNVPKANEHTDGWVTKTVDLSDYAGEEIMAMGLIFSNSADAIENYQVNVGEFRITDGTEQTPAVPTGFAIDKSIDTSEEMLLSWDLADYSEVESYRIYAQKDDGTTQFIGGIYDDNYYVSSAYDSNDYTKFLLTAIGPNGEESEPAVIEYNKANTASNIQVEENAGYLDVSWQNPAVDYEQMQLTVTFDYSAKEESYTQTVSNGVDSARVYVPVADGCDYTLTLTPIQADGTVLESADYFGQLADMRSEPYQGEVHYMGSGKIAFDTPLAEDWVKMYISINGGEEQTLVRSSDSLGSISTGNTVGYGTVTIVTEDQKGNLSVPVTKYYFAEPNTEIDETIIPDDILREAVKAQAGTTVQEVMQYTGTLDLTGMDIHDLTGLNLVSHAETIILSGTPIESIGSGVFGAYVQKVDLSNCTSLKIVDKAAFANARELREVNITGCSSLQVLEIVDTSVEKLSYGDATTFPDLIRLDLSASRFDMSEGTSERIFADEISKQSDESKSVEVMDPNETNLALGAQVVADQTVNYSASLAAKLFDGNYSGYVYTTVLPGVVVADLGSVQSITSWSMYCYQAPNFGLIDFEILASVDGVDYTSVSTIIDNQISPVTVVLPEQIEARYIKLIANEQMPTGTDITELEINGHKVVRYESEVAYDNQRPRLISNMETSITVEKKNGQVLDLNEILDNAIADANAKSVTVNGNTVDDLEGAAWLDPDYALEPDSNGDVRDIHLIRVTNEQGESSYATSIDGSIDGCYTVEYITLSTVSPGGEVLYTFTVNVKGITSVLERVIAEAEQMVADGALDNTMEAVVNEFNAALQAAKDLVAQEYASQEDLNAAAVRLLKVMAKVDWKQGDKTVLEVAVDIANAIKPDLDLYVEAGKQEFLDALAVAESLLESGNAWQEEIDKAADDLMEAMSNLRMKPNKDILNDMINKAEGTDLSGYAEDSVAALNAALANAQTVAADENASQDEVDAAADSLKAAMSGLVFVDGDHNNEANTDDTTADNTTITPVGDGTTPTKTGDTGVAGIASLAVLSAACALVVLKKKQR